MRLTRKISIAVSIVFLLMVGCATNPQQSKNNDVVVAVYKMTNVAITPEAFAGDAVAKQALSTLRQQDIEVAVAGNAGWGNIEVPPSQAEHARKILHKMMSGLTSEAASTSFRVIDQ
jgi:hypothetical protein